MRLIPYSEYPAPMNMGIDEMLFCRRQDGGEDTLRFYGWRPAAVSIGYFQSYDQEIGADDVDVVRRSTGGGAVFHDHEITYSVVMAAGADIQESYRRICGGIIEALNLLGIIATFRPLNDIVVGQRKISGNAQTRRDGVLLQHGTLLLSVDPDRMFSVLRVPDEKLKGKFVRSVRSAVTSVEQELGCQVEIDAVTDALEQGFASVFGPLTMTPISDEEIEEARGYATKYRDEQWTRMR